MFENVDYPECAVQSLTDSTVAELTNNPNLLAVERALHKVLVELARRVLEAALAIVLARATFTRPLHDTARRFHHSMRSKGVRKVRLQTLFGWVEVHVTYWRRGLRKRPGRRRTKRRSSGSGLYPALWAMGIRARRTPAVQAEVCRAMLLCACCREASELLASRGIELGHKDVCRIAYSTLSASVRARDLRLREPDLIDERERILEGRRVVLQLDGGRYRERRSKRAGRRTKKGRRPFSVHWREPKGFIIYVLDEHGGPDKRLDALADFTTGNAADLMRLIEKTLLAYGIDKAVSLTVIADGAHWIWGRSQELEVDLKMAGFAGDYLEVLDFYHAAETLSGLADFVKRWTPGRRERWLRRTRRQLRAGQRDAVLDELAALRSQVAKKRRAAYDNKCVYFSGDNFERIRYDEFRQAKIPCGSGAIESLIRRVVNQRVKGNSCYWLQENAELVMHGRAQLKVGRFEEMVTHATAPYAIAA